MFKILSLATGGLDSQLGSVEVFNPLDGGKPCDGNSFARLVVGRVAVDGAGAPGERVGQLHPGSVVDAQCAVSGFYFVHVTSSLHM